MLVYEECTITDKTNKEDKYLLQTKFEVRTVSYGPSFFPFTYAKRAGRKSSKILYL